MLTSLKALNSDATLNSFQDIGNHQIARGETAKLLFQLVDPNKKLRFIPGASAALSVTLLKSDGTSITKSLSFPFAEDRSIAQLDLTAVETATLTSQNVNVKITDGGNIQYAILQSGLQVVAV